MQTPLISHSSTSYIAVLNILYLSALLYPEISPGISADCTITNKKLEKMNLKHCSPEPLGCILIPCFSHVFKTYFKLSFQQGVTWLYLKKLIICPIFVCAPRIPFARGTLKNGATKKNCAKFTFTHNDQFWEMHKEIRFYIPLTKKHIYGQKQKKWSSSLNSAYTN